MLRSMLYQSMNPVVVTFERLPEDDAHLLGLMEQGLEFPAAAIGSATTADNGVYRFLAEFFESVDF